VRLLALLTDGFGASGGIARFNCDLMTALSDSAAMTSVVALPRFGAAGGAEPGKVRQLPAQASRMAYVLGALGAVARQRFDAVFCGHLFMTPLAATLAQVARIPLWVQVHGIEAWAEPGGSVHRAMRQAQLVTSVSRHTRERLLAWCDIAPERARILPNTVSGEFQPRPRRPDLVARYGLGGRKVVLTVGRLSASERYKGHDRVIAALPRVLRQLAEATYLVVGDGDDLQRLSKAAEAAGVADRVIFTGGVPQDELADYFALADLFAMPSTGEGFGIVFLEAVASGLPVIGGHCDGTRDALADGRIGTLVDPGNTDLLANALIAGLSGRAPSDPAEAARFTYPAFARHVHDLVGELA